MNRILVTGATGNVGTAVINALQAVEKKAAIYAGVRDVNQKNIFPDGVTPVRFDFENATTQKAALLNTDVLFLLRPPQLADVKTYFIPLIARAKEAAVRHIVFLSVQGAEKNRFIPHHKIEAAMRAGGVPFTFLRPAYFMQNFTTTLHRDLVQQRLIFLPAGNARFTLVDVADIGAVAARILCEPEAHNGHAYDLTCSERYTFAEMAALLSEGLQTLIRYTSPSLLQFYHAKRNEGMPAGFILVLIMLHYLPSFQEAPPVSQSIRQVTGNMPTSFREFIAQNKTQFLS